MNKRIRELAEQAELIQERDGDVYLLEHATGELEKFAQLIVRECIDIISPYAVRMENFDGGHPISEIKKHFGVEE